MLKKLLKYDFKAVLRYWWIAALSTVGLAILGGWSWSVFENEKLLPDVLYVVATLAAIVAVLGAVAFAILTVILLFSRFYKNFFTDEGYLTFTLPVKRSTLLNSKLIVSVVTTFMTGVVLVFDLFIAVFFGEYDLIVSKEFWYTVWQDWILEYFETVDGYAVIYILESIVSAVLTVLISTLFVYCCVTIASIIAKKAKVITAIAIYYVTSSVFTFAVQMFYLFGMDSLYSWLYGLPEQYERPVYALMRLGIILLSAIFCGVLYSFQYWMLDRKLNLS